MRVKIILFLAACAVLAVAAQKCDSNDVCDADLYSEDNEDLASELTRRQDGPGPAVGKAAGGHGGHHGSGGQHGAHGGGTHPGAGRGGHKGGGSGGDHSKGGAGGHHGPGNDGKHSVDDDAGLHKHARRHGGGKPIPVQAPTGVDTSHNPFRGQQHQQNHQHKGHGGSPSQSGNPGHKGGNPDPAFSRAAYNRLESALGVHLMRRGAGKAKESEEAMVKKPLPTKTINQEISPSRHTSQAGGDGGSSKDLMKGHVPTKDAAPEMPPSRHSAHAGGSGGGGGDSDDLIKRPLPAKSEAPQLHKGNGAGGGGGDGDGGSDDLQKAPNPTKSAAQQSHKGNAGGNSAGRHSSTPENPTEVLGRILKDDLHENPFAPFRKRTADSDDDESGGGGAEREAGGINGHVSGLGNRQGGSGGHSGSGGHPGSGDHSGSGGLGGHVEGPHAADTGHLRKVQAAYAHNHPAAKPPPKPDSDAGEKVQKAAKPPSEKDLAGHLAESGHTVEKPPLPMDLGGSLSKGEKKAPKLGGLAQSASKAALGGGGHFEVHTAPGILMPSGGLPSKIKGEFGSRSAKITGGDLGGIVD